MHNKKVKLMFLILVIVLFGVLITFFLKSQNNNYIPNDYIAIFHGGVGEQTHETYLYIISNEDTDKKFKYINVTSTTESWGSAQWIQKIDNKGKAESLDEIFKIAKKHGSYSYVTLPNDNTLYTIEEFKMMFNDN